MNLYWNNFVPKKTGNPCKYLLSCKLLMKITHTPASTKPCTEEKRFPNKILDSSQLLSSTLNITQEGCEKLQRVQAQGSVVLRKERSYNFSILFEPAYYGHILWSPTEVSVLTGFDCTTSLMSIIMMNSTK